MPECPGHPARPPTVIPTRNQCWISREPDRDRRRGSPDPESPTPEYAPESATPDSRRSADRRRTTEAGRRHRSGGLDARGRGRETLVVIDDLGGMSLEDAIDATIVAFDDGDIVTAKS